MNNAETSEADERRPKQWKFRLYLGFYLLLCATSGLFVIQAEKRYFDGMKDSFCDQQIINELQCTNLTISDGLQYWSSPFTFKKNMNFTVVFNNPYSRHVNVEKYPMEKNDHVFVHESEIIWKGSFDVSGTNEIPKTILSFHYKTRLEQCDDFYYVSCPTLNTMIKEHRKEWKDNGAESKLLQSFAATVVFCFVLIAFGVLVGYLISKCLKS